MTPRSDYRTSNIPDKPGVYLFRDRMGTVIYVGKAKSLRRRLANYFQPSRQQTADPKLRSLIHSIAFFEFHVVRTDEESLLLESRLIKQFSPRYNIVLRDDKRFLLIRIDPNVPFPRLHLARMRKDDGCLYYGPYPIAGALRETVDYLTRHFGLRSCSARLPDATDYEHCNDDVVRFCTAPCVGKLSQAAYRERVDQVIAVIEGKTAEVIADLRQRMEQHAANQQYERAAKLRDVMQNLQTVFGAQNRTFTRSTLATYPGAEGVRELHQALALPEPPVVIECFDISNIMGQFTVASMVRFADGAPERQAYRRFRIKEVAGIDDFASMGEVVERRYRRLLAESARLPNLIVIDGGRGQLNAAHERLSALGLGHLPILGLAKREEEIYLLDRSEPLRLQRHQASLRLLQAIRDEAHRFAISYNQALRRKQMVNSLLDEIPGVGKKRRDEILKAFGSVRALRRHDREELCRRVPGIGEKLAAEIMRHVGREDSP